MQALLLGDLRPAPGDLVLARVDEIGKHTKLELTDGRRAHMFPGDEIVVAYGNRYAPDQYEATVALDLSPCDLVAAGGIAANEIARHQRMRPPTRITPIGLIAGANGQRLNLSEFGLNAPEHFPEIPAILSLGTSMNAGKTLTATSLVRGFRRLGYRVAALKITGTGAGGDMWIVRDAGADVTLDFTDAGFPSTYLEPVSSIERGAFRLMNHAAALGCDVAVVEIADGLHQLETGQLIRSRAIRDMTLGVVFAAYDAMGAKCGVDVLRDEGHAVLALSGRLGRSPLGVREAEKSTGLKVFSPWELQEGALVPDIRALAAERYAASGFRNTALRRLAETPAVPATVHRLAQPSTDRLRDILVRAAHLIMERDVSALCGARFGARAENRRDRRNGFRDHDWTTPVGPVRIKVPRLRNTSYLPAFLDRPLNGETEAVLSASDAGLDDAIRRLLTKMTGDGQAANCAGELAEEIRMLRGDGFGAASVAHATIPFGDAHDAPPDYGVDDLDDDPLEEFSDPAGPSVVPAETEAFDVALAFQPPRAIAGE